MDSLINAGLIWWQGIVQDIDDPEKIGRVKVRIFGYHTEEVDIDLLPWASPLMPITSASIGGLGTSPTGVVTGAWVVGFFRDGSSAEDPIIFGTVPGKPQTKINTENAFSDPDGLYPTENKDSLLPNGSVLGESDVNRLATGDNTSETIVQEKKDSLDSKSGEPSTPYAAEYPHNNVISTKSGHHVELDDTPGAERIHIYHKSGTFIEIHPDGTTVKKSKSDDYEIIEGDKTVHIKGNYKVIVDGKISVDVGSSAEYKYGGTHKVNSGGTHTIEAPKLDLNP